ncbi:MAG TPA: CotH kinase family protein, partial [Myxococcales bacterium]|nr:CotH kinase family protein [Myxococcales bacterium]
MLYRLYKASFLTGVLLSAPILLGVAWYAWSTYAGLDRYRRAAKVKDQPLDAELFQVALHDELTGDLRRMQLQDRPARSALPTFNLFLDRSSLDQLGRRGGQEGEESYAPALLQKDGRTVEVRVRYRGGQPWHLLGAQKSMKVRVDRGQLVDGDRVFNLLNDPTPFGLEEQLILDLSRRLGLLTPDYRPVRVRLNNADLGVYRYETQPDEGLLRRSRRMPGSLYSGDTEAVDPRTGDGALFSSVAGWQKVASRTPEEAQDFSELERLLEAVSRGTHRQFARFAAEELDLERYAAFDALDVVFGNSEHDYFSNHKLYFDPYAGRFEPVAWSFRGFNHEPRINMVDHPLLIRLKLTPGYLARRNRAVLELLNGSASVPEVRAAAQRHFEALYPELAADPYWDAYKLLPRVSRFHRFMVRPMSRGRWALAADAELEDYARRSRFVVDQLESGSAEGFWSAGGVVVRVGGQGGVR